MVTWRPAGAGRELEGDAAALGLELEPADGAGGEDDNLFAVWPENREAVELFVQLRTQWRIVAGFGAAAHTGLDYAAVEAVFRIRRVAPADRARLLDDVRVMESAYLSEVNKRADG